MAVKDQDITPHYALYNGDCVEGLRDIPEKSIHLTIYSPPFCGLYNYSSDPRDMSNCKSYEEFFEHYTYLARELRRVTMPGRLSVVHCMDVPGKNGDLVDFTGDVIRMHEREGWMYHARFAIWKEPLRVAIRTRSKGLMHKQIVSDSSWCNNAGADYLLVFRNTGENPTPITHPLGFSEYAGEREVPQHLREKYTNWQDPKTNKLSHWIWQQYASAFWDDIRNNRVLPYREARDVDDEKHVHPLQLDVIDRCVQLWSNPGEKVLTPFMGVGSEVYGAVYHGRLGIGFELKETYFRQAVKNVRHAMEDAASKTVTLFDEEPIEEQDPG